MATRPSPAIVHLLKLCVGVDHPDELRRWQRDRLAKRRRQGEPAVLEHWTRNMPKRRAEVLAGGSLYWVIRGRIQVRQRILDLSERADEDGRRFCAIGLDPPLVAVQPWEHRAFQGWRYLDAADAPPDARRKGLAEATAGDEPSPEMLAELRSLGLI